MSIENVGRALSQRQVYASAGTAKSGQTTLSKEDLAKIKSAMASQFDELLSSSDTVNINGDDISSAELGTYSSNAGVRSQKGTEPPSLSKDELTAMRDHIASDPGQSTEAFDSVIKNFEDVDTDEDGKVSRNEFSTYAQTQGLKMPDPPSGPPPRPPLGQAQSSNGDMTSDSSNSGTGSLLQMMIERYSSSLGAYTSSSTSALSQQITA